MLRVIKCGLSFQVDSVSKRSQSSGTSKKSSSSQTSDAGDFFAPRRRCKRTQLREDEDENASAAMSADDKPRVNETVKTENVRRSSRLSAQAAAALIARVSQVT